MNPTHDPQAASFIAGEPWRDEHGPFDPTVSFARPETPRYQEAWIGSMITDVRMAIIED